GSSSLSLHDALPISPPLPVPPLVLPLEAPSQRSTVRPLPPPRTELPGWWQRFPGERIAVPASPLAVRQRASLPPWFREPVGRIRDRKSTRLNSSHVK